ncbi:MAG TPA: hypothetical protein DCL77_15575 [Prolixibacteraceae bacterium]|jgi:hypothetical protein|nr:hypothetical protein [Prolixibacteraceae bacterium]
MGTSEIRKEIHDYIDHADDRFLRLVYSMVENEQIEAGSNLFSTKPEDMVTRAKASLLSVTEGRTRNIKSFKKEVDSWKKQQNTL